MQQNHTAMHLLLLMECPEGPGEGDLIAPEAIIPVERFEGCLVAMQDLLQLRHELLG